MDKSNESLGRRLRHAAVERTDSESARVGDFVLDDDGVIDLRDFEDASADVSIAAPAAALATIRGQLGDAAEISDLYDESEGAPSRWRLGLRARRARRTDTPAAKVSRATPAPTPRPSAAPVPTRRPPTIVPSRLSMIPLSPSTDHAPPGTVPEPTVEVPDTDVVEAEPRTGGFFSATRPAPVPEPEIDLRDDERPTAECPRCANLGRRDLFDRFSQVEFYSCDSCLHMWQKDRG